MVHGVTAAPIPLEDLVVVQIHVDQPILLYLNFMKHTLPTLYKRSSSGKIQLWTVEVDGDAYTVIEGYSGGKLTQTAPHACEGKNPGKKNATTAAQQAEKEAQALWEKKLRRGYMENEDAVDNTAYEKPMKGDKYKDRKDEVEFPGTAQNKLNGVNFRVKAKGILSTGCELYHTVPHIVESFQAIFKKYPKATFVGEGYNPDTKFLGQLTEVMNVNIQPKDLTPELLKRSEEIAQCWIFDGYGFENITEKTPWVLRIEACRKLLQDLPHVVITPYTVVEDEIHLMELLEQNKEAGGEGLMFRWGTCPVKHGKSKYLLKLKHFEDAEFKLIRIEEGNGSWAGCAKRAVLELPEPVKDRDGNTVTEFAANIRGDEAYLRKMYQVRETLYGEPATTSYQELSEWGIPLLPWVEAIRNYETYTKK